jgi:hypothetical protein
VRLSLRILLGALALTACAATCGAASLRFTDPGIYGTDWVRYALQKPDSFDWLIYQARLQQAGADRIPSELESLNKAGIRLVVNMEFLTKDQRGMQGIQAGPKLEEPPHYVDMFASVLDRVGAMPIEALTIEEENLYEGGRGEFLGDLYSRLKEKYPNHNFYQWYSPRLTPSIAIPGKTWPNLPSDGWVVDQYGIYDKEFAEYIGQMMDLHKPLLGVVWACPQWRVGEHAKKHDEQWWDNKGWKMMYSQLATYRKYDVPVSFFMFANEDGPNGRKTVALYQSKDQCDQKFLDAFVSGTLPMIRSGKSIPAAIPKQRPAWIPGHCG